ncbi:hypothetical protein Ddye_027572 [Dipteronia dyeriana]|uniref:ADP-ribosyl cyclase/cyclic ADP-ribose hydrolase n=1 Tax=Dipteronia dyeriana TaxID=168575 RepID=A0AAD9TPT6_9ROSI|nr:hypothetical protein Ddye_027572 [Dipteronia dyeriana]
MASSSTPSSTITLIKKYHVFLSFRGEDTRVGFTSHLYDALSRKQIVTFIDYEFARGDEIYPALLKSIQESMIAVVIFSKDYASSKWCLRELTEIMKCKKLHQLIVLPVFYNVNPSDVRKQTGPFKDSFARHENESQEEVIEWRKAFTEASNLFGLAFAKTRSESELVSDIVKDVQRNLMSEIEYISPCLNDFEGLIGIHKRIEQVISLLCLSTMDVRIIGIWGMGGIGKTTLAEAVFNQISSQFDGSYFIEKVGERLENRESNRLQLEVLSKVLHEENLKLCTFSNTIPPFIKERFNRVKVFIVIDDVNNFLQSETLVNSLIRCGLGSRIIITSRDKQVLYNFKVLDCEIYEVEGLNFDEALMLFSNYAFNQNHPTEDFMDLSIQMICYAKGNPLTLKVLGSYLLGMSKQEWESAFVDLQGIGDSEIFNVLKISYHRLNGKEKNLFLNIACFFNGHFEDDVAKLLDCKYSLRVLVNKSLVTIEEGGIKMHNLLQEMGREIVRRESPKNPDKRSRLWKPDDVIRTLKNNTGTKEVEGISLNMDHLKDVHLNLSCQVFDKMSNLKLLFFTCPFMSNKVHLPNGLNSLPDDLIILEWYRYPLKALPSNFSPEKLVKLDLSFSNIEQLWEGSEHAPKLKWLILIYCQRLTRIPNLSHFLSLEEVDLQSCKSLVEFPSPVQQLNKLRYLSLDGCSKVTKFPLTSASIEMLNLSETAIEEVPSSIQNLTNLRRLYLSNCTRLKHISAGIFKLKSLLILRLNYCSELETFPEISETVEILNSLELSGTAIKELGSSIEHTNELQRLTLSNCKNLEMLPSSICNLTSLEDLHLSSCSKLNKLPDNLRNLKSLKNLTVEGSAVGQLPSSITCLENLEFLNCFECRNLTILPPLSGLRSLSRLFLKKCNLIEIPKDIGCLSSLTQLELCGNMFESLPKSIKHLTKLETLSLRECNMLRSLTELPIGLRNLEAINCKQLCQALPDASEFKRCITSKYHNYGSEETPTHFSIYLPGSEIPEWFTYQSSGSSVNIQLLRQDLVNRKFMGFAICAVLRIEEYHSEHQFLGVRVNCHFETYDHYISFPLYYNIYNRDGHGVFINSDHILLGYSSFSKFDYLHQNLKKLFVGDIDYMHISFEIKERIEDYKMKHYAVHPIYAESKEIIDATIEDIGETSGRRNGGSDGNEEEVEPYLM